MMFLQYAIWGAWLPILWPYLADVRGFKADEIGTMFMVGAVGARGRVRGGGGCCR